MKIYIHIGVPKTGSSAIQAHLAINTKWLEQHGYVLPLTGHVDGYGHILLFEDKTDEHLEKLAKELQQLETQGFESAILTFEGLNTFGTKKLANIKAHLDPHTVKVIVYLREQTQVIQSGYCQASKQRSQKRTIRDYLNNDGMLTLARYDYEKLLDRYASIFGVNAITARVYERQNLKQKNIVVDFLEAIDIYGTEDFILSADDQNISLDAGSTYFLNTFDSINSSDNDRDAVVDILLCEILKNGPDSKYFLSEEKVFLIKEHYRVSNQNTLDKYVRMEREILFLNDNPTHLAEDNLETLAGRKLKLLDKLIKYRSWNGEELSGLALKKVASQTEGWALPERWGVWSKGGRSTIRFRILPTTISPDATSVALCLTGKYFSDNTSTQVSVEDGVFEKLNLEKSEIEIPLNLFDNYGRITIELQHQNPISPKDLSLDNDERKLAYAITKAFYKVY
jgi:hypothetical protein